MRAAVLAVLCALGLAACKRPSPEDCVAAVKNWKSLMFWDKAEQELAAAPAEQREAMRKAKTAELDSELKRGMNLAIMQCRGSRDFAGVKCMKEATTATQAKLCRGLESK